MAVALRGSAVVPAGNPTTGFSVTIPSSVVTDDLCYLTLTSRDSTGAGTLSVTDNDTGGNAWTKIANSTDHKITVWRKRATAASASKSVTVANAVGSCSGVLKCFSGADAGATPESNIVVETNASGDEAHAGFTPDSADSMLCAAVANYANDNAVTSLAFATAGATTATEKLSTGGNDCANIFGHVLQSGGPSASGNLTWAQTNGTTYSVTWAIKPKAATTVAVGQASDSETAQALSKVKIGALGQPADSEAGQVITGRKVFALWQVSTTETVQPITLGSGSQTITVGLVQDAESAQPVTGRKVGALAQVEEANTAQPIVGRKSASLGQPATTETANSIAAVKAVPLGQSSDSESAQAINALKAQSLGFAQDNEIAQSIRLLAPQVIVLGLSEGYETAFGIGARQVAVSEVGSCGPSKRALEDDEWFASRSKAAKGRYALKVEPVKSATPQRVDEDESEIAAVVAAVVIALQDE